MIDTDNCPLCGAAHIGVNYWGCGSDPFFQSDRCKERAELAATKRELEEYRKERQDFIDRDNAMKMAVQDDAERLRKVEARVRELEGLEIWNGQTKEGGRWVEVFIPFDRIGENASNLGEAMPGGGQ